MKIRGVIIFSYIVSLFIIMLTFGNVPVVSLLASVVYVASIVIFKNILTRFQLTFALLLNICYIFFSLFGPSLLFWGAVEGVIGAVPVYIYAAAYTLLVFSCLVGTLSEYAISNIVIKRLRIRERIGLTTQ